VSRLLCRDKDRVWRRLGVCEYQAVRPRKDVARNRPEMQIRQYGHFGEQTWSNTALNERPFFKTRLPRGRFSRYDSVTSNRYRWAVLMIFGFNDYPVRRGSIVQLTLLSAAVIVLLFFAWTYIG